MFFGRGLGLLLVFVFLLAGCTGARPKLGGFHKQLPRPQSRLVVLPGTRVRDGTALSTTVQWLQEQGVAVLERRGMPQILGEQLFRLTYMPDSEANLLRVGRMLGADQVVLVDTELFREWASIRGVSVETGEVLWTAQYASATSFPSDPEVIDMIRAALEHAWSSAGSSVEVFQPAAALPTSSPRTELSDDQADKEAVRRGILRSVRESRQQDREFCAQLGPMTRSDLESCDEPNKSEAEEVTDTIDWIVRVCKERRPRPDEFNERLCQVNLP